MPPGQRAREGREWERSRQHQYHVTASSTILWGLYRFTSWVYLTPAKGGASRFCVHRAFQLVLMQTSERGTLLRQNGQEWKIALARNLNAVPAHPNCKQTGIRKEGLLGAMCFKERLDLNGRLISLYCHFRCRKILCWRQEPLIWWLLGKITFIVFLLHIA